MFKVLDLEERQKLARKWVDNFGSVQACAKALDVTSPRVSQCVAKGWFAAHLWVRALDAGKRIGAIPPIEIFEFSPPLEREDDDEDGERQPLAGAA